MDDPYTIIVQWDWTPAGIQNDIFGIFDTLLKLMGLVLQNSTGQVGVELSVQVFHQHIKGCLGLMPKC